MTLIIVECMSKERRRLQRMALSRCDNPPALAEECARSHDAYTVRHAKCKRVEFRFLTLTNKCMH